MDNLLWLIIGAVVALLGGGWALSSRKKKAPGAGMTPEKFDEKVRERTDELEKKSASDIIAGLGNPDDVESVKRESGNRIQDRFTRILNRRKREKREKRGTVD